MGRGKRRQLERQGALLPLSDGERSKRLPEQLAAALSAEAEELPILKGIPWPDGFVAHVYPRGERRYVGTIKTVNMYEAEVAWRLPRFGGQRERPRYVRVEGDEAVLYFNRAEAKRGVELARVQFSDQHHHQARIAVDGKVVAEVYLGDDKVSATAFSSWVSDEENPICSIRSALQGGQRERLDLRLAGAGVFSLRMPTL
jgi:hypothetical protein